MSTTVSAQPSARLKWARQQLGKSQQEFAAALELSLTGYQNYERGDRETPPDVMQRAETKLGIRAAWLGTGTGEPFSDADSTPAHLRTVRDADTQAIHSQVLAAYQAARPVVKSLLTEHGVTSDLLEEALTSCLAKASVKQTFDLSDASLLARVFAAQLSRNK